MLVVEYSFNDVASGVVVARVISCNAEELKGPKVSTMVVNAKGKNGTLVEWSVIMPEHSHRPTKRLSVWFATLLEDQNTSFGPVMPQKGKKTEPNWTWKH